MTMGLVLIGVAVGSVLLRLGAALSGVPPRQNSYIKALGAVALVATLGVATSAFLAFYLARAGSIVGLVATMGITVVLIRRIYGIATGEAVLLSLASWAFVVAYSLLLLNWSGEGPNVFL